MYKGFNGDLQGSFLSANAPFTRYWIIELITFITVAADVYPDILYLQGKILLTFDDNYRLYVFQDLILSRLNFFT